MRHPRRLVLTAAALATVVVVGVLIATVTPGSTRRNPVELSLRTVDTSAGTMVVTGSGMAVYVYLPDSTHPSVSTCTGDCANDWPPVEPKTPTPRVNGIPQARVGELTRADGSRQLTLDGYPLYRYAGDRKPGETRGESVGNAWFAIAPDGNFVALPPSSFASTGPASKQVLTVVSTPYGRAVADDEGQTLYTFRDDTPAGSACTQAWCVQDWPPLTVERPPGPLPGILASVGVIRRPDGSLQITLAGRPLYRFSGDEHPGELTGSGIGSDWYPVTPAGVALGNQQHG